MGGEETKRGSMIFSSVRGHPTRGEWGLFFVEVGASVLISDFWTQHAMYSSWISSRHRLAHRLADFVEGQ